MADRAAYISGLRKLADLLEQHDLPLPVEGTVLPLAWHFWPEGKDDTRPRAALATAAQLLPVSRWAKRYDDTYFRMDGKLDGINVTLIAYRDNVCERVVVGTREVTREVPDPSVAVPMVEVTETVEDVHWECGPLLAEAVAE